MPYSRPLPPFSAYRIAATIGARALRHSGRMLTRTASSNWQHRVPPSFDKIASRAASQVWALQERERSRATKNRMMFMIPIYRQDCEQTLDRTCEFCDQGSNTECNQHKSLRAYAHITSGLALLASLGIDGDSLNGQLAQQDRRAQEAQDNVANQALISLAHGYHSTHSIDQCKRLSLVWHRKKLRDSDGTIQGLGPHTLCLMNLKRRSNRFRSPKKRIIYF